ncbi:MAG: MoxR family ATPase [Steroidobacteraceae bacterium]|nr:MoxR family ATPase [Steroidobacteraceae bacterium]MDW8259512.1 MoxR family ATPase [Gammaproteobacteria bacterium]
MEIIDDDLEGLLASQLRSHGAESAQPSTGDMPETRASAETAKWFSKLFGWRPKLGLPATDTSIFGSIQSWPEPARERIPNPPVVWHWPRRETELLVFALLSNTRTSLIWGPTGTGKSALVRSVCAMLKVPLWQVSCHQSMEAADLLGSETVKLDESAKHLVLRHELAVAGLAAKYGGVLLLDEMFRSPVLLALQSLLENGGSLYVPNASASPEDRIVTPPTGRFWIVGTDNTNGVGDDAGHYQAIVQDLSTLDRIECSIQLDYPSPDNELLLLRKVNETLSDSAVRTILSVANEVRKTHQIGKMSATMSLRATCAIAERASVLGLDTAFYVTFAAKLNKTDRSTFREIWKQKVGRESMAW